MNELLPNLHGYVKECIRIIEKIEIIPRPVYIVIIECQSKFHAPGTNVLASSVAFFNYLILGLS